MAGIKRTTTEIIRASSPLMNLNGTGKHRKKEQVTQPRNINNTGQRTYENSGLKQTGDD